MKLTRKHLRRIILSEMYTSITPALERRPGGQGDIAHAISDDRPIPTVDEIIAFINSSNDLAEVEAIKAAALKRGSMLFKILSPR